MKKFLQLRDRNGRKVSIYTSHDCEGRFVYGCTYTDHPPIVFPFYTFLEIHYYLKGY